MGRLTTHVLDTSAGRPAAGVKLELVKLHEGRQQLLKTLTTNNGGRTDEPLLAGAALEPGMYELIFHAGDYFRQSGARVTEPPFLDEVVIRFGVADADENYHVPLLLAPYGYSTYRGS